MLRAPAPEETQEPSSGDWAARSSTPSSCSNPMMSSLLPFFLLYCFMVHCAASAVNHAGFPPAVGFPKKCKTLRVRVEWRRLHPHQKKEYIQAVRCLQHLPSRNTTNPHLRTRFDELQSTHIDLADDVHTVGQFLPWHRQFAIIHERMLRMECGYKGPIPYWNWTKDADHLEDMKDSPVFDPEFGFGGDGVPNTYTLPQNYTSLVTRVAIDPYAWRGCVKDGEFASYPISFGPGKLVTDHCLVRNINNTYKQALNSESVRRAMKLQNFELFRIEVEGRPFTRTPRMHDAIHALVGGDMSNFYSSVADPLFFLHHSNVDRIWWLWQQIDPSKRLYEITGRSTVDPPYRNVTLDDILEFESLSPPITIRQVMDIHAEPACYTYV